MEERCIEGRPPRDPNLHAAGAGADALPQLVHRPDALGQKVSWGAQRRGGLPRWRKPPSPTRPDPPRAARGMDRFPDRSATRVLDVPDPRGPHPVDPAILSSPARLRWAYGSSRPWDLRDPEESRPCRSWGARRRHGPAPRDRPSRRPDLKANYGMLQAVLDPYVNAVHVSLLRDEGRPAPRDRGAVHRTQDHPPARRARGAHRRDRISLLMDAESMHLLHQEAWATPAAPGPVVAAARSSITPGWLQRRRRRLRGDVINRASLIE
jgi:hypothetical protein